MDKVKAFLKRKDIVISVKRYGIDALGAMAQGLFYYGDWIRRPGVAICSCNDGLRPVIFKLEATDEVSEIGYTPVR